MDDDRLHRDLGSGLVTDLSQAIAPAQNLALAQTLEPTSEPISASLALAPHSEPCAPQSKKRATDLLPKKECGATLTHDADIHSVQSLWDCSTNHTAFDNPINSNIFKDARLMDRSLRIPPSVPLHYELHFFRQTSITLLRNLKRRKLSIGSYCIMEEGRECSKDSKKLKRQGPVAKDQASQSQPKVHLSSWDCWWEMACSNGKETSQNYLWIDREE
ncbi:uncharacterized protein LY89DRAFT_669393 [Mollisia scopiformis]|uniref:Uncharacterized protein n=1 Tax=Mollisia scopiformis TaxID=149040 RepID=A0A194XB29_MOLSC|nr:uncharacterized protein LY89DRAFT_669393 [Mollisia scopiformis]KUJ16957.1 hypothetical protein LY89DRAFT_669393 [Mollisia scopiformis]